LGFSACHVSGHPELLAELDALLPELAHSTRPVVLEVAVKADETFQP
jgi:benzoylformate decarboxylase